MSQYFSRMLTKDGIRPATPAGTWQQETYLTLLSTFAANLDVSNVSSNADSLNSVPVPWARLILFENALFNVEHPVHLEIKNQWRGMLGLLALANPLGLTLGLKDINLHGYQHSSIAKTFIDLCPNESENNLDKWSRFQILTLGEAIIGATSPRTLVFTGISPACPASVPFSIRGRLSDPVRYYRYFNDTFYLSLLYTWLEGFIRTLQNNRNIESLLGTFPVGEGGLMVTRQSRLLESLREWQNEIGYIQPFPVEGALQSFFTLPPYNEITGLPAISQEPQSDLFLHNNNRLMVSYNLRQNSQIYNSNNNPLSGEPLKVYNGRWVGANQELPSPLDFVPANIKQIANPTRLFEETLLVADLPDNPEAVYFLEAAGEKNRFLFPFKPEILDYFSPEEINANTSIKKNLLTNSLIVELRFPLINNRVITVRREYQPEQIILDPVSEDLAKWPDFVSPDWNYYIYYRKANPDGLRFEPYGSTIKRSWEDQNDYECHLSTEPLKAFIGKYNSFSGLLLLRQDNKPAPLNAYWKVGVDFGSTHTRAFYREVEQQGDDFVALSNTIKPIIFSPRAKELTECSAEIRVNFPERSNELVQNWQLEQEELNTRLRPPAIEHQEFENWLPREGFIFKYSLEHIKNAVLREDLKWNNNHDNYDMRSFLRSLLLMIEAEACAGGAQVVSFRHTYPSVFTPGLIRKHDNEWNGLEGFINKWRNPGLTRVQIPSADIMETVAVCRHLAAEQAAVPTSNTISLDVGGSTTDIAVWAESELKLQESVKLSAGVIGKYLQSPRAVSFLQWLIPIVKDKPFNTHFELNTFKNNPSAYFNDLLSTLSWSGQLRELILNVISEPEKTGEFLAHIVYTFSALLYYGGLLARKQNLHQKNEDFYLYFCGRGGKLIEWITKADEPEFYENLVNEMFLAGLRGPQNVTNQKTISVKTIISRFPKEEVGRGLLAESALVGNKKESFMTVQPNTVTVGESAYPGLKWEGELTPGTLKNLKSDQIPEMNQLAELMNFINVFSTAPTTRESARVLQIKNVRPSEYKNKLVERLFGKGKGSIVFDLNNYPDDALLEPLFITELKVLLETATNNSKLFSDK